MEVIDSHMTERFPAAPTHIDVDMSAEYDDDAEYAMHDVTEATTTNDEEIYDAEFEEVPEHTEIEMDEYADGVESETMGTYAPTDDGATATDVTVEDVQLRSSPAPAGTPQVATINPISPHVPLDADLPLNDASTKTLADHSPHSAATLVGDSEVEPLPLDTKDDSLNEVIDLTEDDDEPHIVPIDVAQEAASVNPVEPIDQALPQSEHEATQDELDEAEREFYEAEEPVGLLSTDTTAPGQSNEKQEDERHSGHTDQDEPIAAAPISLQIPEQTDQGGHSPIEEALVLNQQARDDAADSMEPSPPIRLYYRDEGKGTNEIFDIFTPIGSESAESVVLFHDNRTLFYEPLSAFFAQLRETEYFSGDEWDNAETGIRMDVGDSSISINEDHKETENISLFKLASIWSGLGLEEPLELTLVRRSERFAIQLARLVEQVEQRDFHHEDATEPSEARHDVETGGPEINLGDVGDEDSDSASLENNDQESKHGMLTNLDGIPDDLPRDMREVEDPQAPSAVQPESPDEQRQETNGNDQIATTIEIGADKNLKETAQDIPPSNQEPTTQPINDDYQGTEVEGTDPALQDDDDNTVSDGQSPSTPTPKPQEDEYDEYEVEEANESTPAQTSVQNEASSAGWDAQEYDYEEDYEGATEEHSKRTLPENAPNEPRDPSHAPPTPSAPKLQGHESLQTASLKRNLNELEYEEYETPSAPSSPASDHKRVKHT